MTPRNGSMVWWRPKGKVEYRFGYCTHLSGSGGLVRMGAWAGDVLGGSVVSPEDIDCKEFKP